VTTLARYLTIDKSHFAPGDAIGSTGLHVGWCHVPYRHPNLSLWVSAPALVNPDAAVLDLPPAEVRPHCKEPQASAWRRASRAVRPALQLDRILGIPAPDAVLELVETQGLSLGQRCPFRFRTARTKAVCASTARLSPRARATAELALSLLAQGHDFLVYVPARLARSRGPLRSFSGGVV
jgi:hypothetical protein